jgi:proteasome lid subunit RPN8/RPN11
VVDKPVPDLLPDARPTRTMTAYISQNAFWGLLISAVEVYKRECFGLLIGYRDRKGPEEMYIVEHAVPFQSAGRKHKGVVSNPRAHKRIERFLEAIPQLSVIGDFHSHTMWGYSKAASHPSETDLEGMSPENLYVIVSINDKLRAVPWSYNDDQSLSGTTNEHYFRLTAYTVNSAGESRRTPILCPYAIGFNARPLRAIK